MKKSLCTIFEIIALALLMLAISGCRSNIPDPLLPSKEAFNTPPMEYRPVPLWFWNNTNVTKDEIEQQIASFIEKDLYGGFAILPFGKDFRPEFLSEAYFEAYGKALEIAADKGLHVSFYDEYGFPSGSAGAIHGDGIPRFKNQHPEHTIKRLDKTDFFVAGPSAFQAEIEIKGTLMAIVAMDTVNKTRVDLSKMLAGNRLQWDAPEGNWKIMVFESVIDGDPNVDYLDPEAVKKFINMIHQTYYDNFSNYFGTTIRSTFFDEPTMYRANGRIWTDGFNTKFIATHGFDPAILYPALWYDIGEETAAARNYLFGFRSELYAKGFHKTIQEWCDKHGISATGHQDNEEIINPVSTSGDLMKWSKYIDIPGIDKIGGNRPAERFYKVISSAAANWDKTLVMSETYGAMGNLSWEQMYHVAMEQYVKGINMLIPHAIWYNDQKVTFLPELSWRNPLYQDGLPEFNTFLSRLNSMLQPEGRMVAEIAILYPITSLQADHFLDGPLGYYRGGVDIPDADYAEISELLTNTLGYDFTYLHPEVLRQQCEVINGELHLKNLIHHNQYRMLIIPSMRTISPYTLQIANAFYLSGGTIIFTTQLPSQSSEFETHEQVRRAVAGIFNSEGFYDQQPLFNTNKNGGKAYFIPNPDSLSLQNALEASLPGFHVQFVGTPLNYMHKQVGNTDVFYFTNLKSNDINTKVALRGKMNLELRDPHNGHIKEIKPAIEVIDSVTYSTFDLLLPRNRSVFVLGRR
jgi:hypothetical protein